MLVISELYIYPVKSLGGISVHSANITSRGLQFDRRWMLVDENNKFLTQREHPQMALFRTGIENDSISIYHLDSPWDITSLPLEPPPSHTISVTVWEDTCEAQTAPETINQWFSQKLSIQCRAVYMPSSSARKLDPAYSVSNEDITSFSDGYPMLLIGQASLDDLNQRLQEPLPMNRFRPNIVFSGGTPFQEDDMKKFNINDIDFYGVKLCGRCAITTTNQETAQRSKEPLATLATYRTIGNKVCFGQNIISSGQGLIRVGDVLHHGSRVSA